MIDFDKIIYSWQFQENDTTDHLDLIEGFALFAINADQRITRHKQQAAIR
jgi:hypothetical protein